MISQKQIDKNLPKLEAYLKKKKEEEKKDQKNKAKK